MRFFAVIADFLFKRSFCFRGVDSDQADLQAFLGTVVDPEGVAVDDSDNLEGFGLG